MAGIVAGAPYLAGVKAEEALRAALTDEAVGPWQVRGVEYARGWWSSTLRVQLAISTGPKFAADFAVRHGPLDFHTLLDGRPGDVFALAVLDSTGPLSGAMRTRIALDGTAHSFISVRDRTFVTGPQVRLSIGALDAQLQCPPSGASCTGRVQARGLNLTGNAGFLAARELELQLAAPAPDAYAQHWRLAGFEHRRGDRAIPPLQAGSARIDYSIGSDGGKVSVAIDARFEQLQVAGHSARSAAIKASLERLALAALPEARASLARYALSRGDPQREARALLALWQALGPMLHSRPAVLVHRLELITDVGAARGHGRIAVHRVPLDDSPESLMRALVGELSLSLPASLVDAPFAEEARAELAQLEQRDDIPPLTSAQRDRAVSAAARERAAAWAGRWYLRRDDGAYRLDARLGNGVLQVNGQALDFRP